AIDYLTRGALRRGRELAELVVLADEHQRKLPQAADVQALHEHTLVGSAVAEEGRGDSLALVELRGKRGTGGDREPAAHDAVRAEDSLGEIRHVHRAAHALADAGLLRPDLGHHRRRIAALGKEVAV